MPQADGPDLFDPYGRCLPGPTNAPVHRQSRRYFRLAEPDIDPAAILARTTRHLAPDLSISAETLTSRLSATRDKLEADPVTRNILCGVAVPFVLPRMPAGDIGETFDSLLLPAVGRAFKAHLPDYDFVNHHPAGTAGKLSPRAGGRHERLLTALDQGAVCGLYFPCLTEYSVDAAIERLADLPADFLLSGPFDTAAALIGTPDLLLRKDGYPPLLWLSGAAAETPDVGYHFEAYGYNLTFNRRPHLGQAAEYWWHGLTVLCEP